MHCCIQPLPNRIALLALCLPPYLLQLRTSGPGGAYLLYTTRQHTLHTLPVASLAAGSGGLPDQRQHAGAPQQQQWWQGFRVAMRAGMRPTGATAAGVTVRNIEQNALLIAVPPGEQLAPCVAGPAIRLPQLAPSGALAGRPSAAPKPALVSPLPASWYTAGGVQAILQMPRGNLEAVCPRALVLPAIAAALDAGDYAGGACFPPSLSPSASCSSTLLRASSSPACLPACLLSCLCACQSC